MRSQDESLAQMLKYWIRRTDLTEAYMAGVVSSFTTVIAKRFESLFDVPEWMRS